MAQKPLWWVAFGILGGLLGAGLILLISSRPRGQGVELLPAPTAAPLRVHVVGAVAQPGVYSLPPGSRVEAAIAAAGGALPAADLQRMNLADWLEDGQRLVLPYQPELAPTGAPDFIDNSGADRGTGVELDSPTPTLEGGLIDINHASQEELEQLPHIGPTIAQRIIEYRTQNGPFGSIEEIQNVAGIGEKIYADIQNLITVK